jgi:methylmalonyl-CoA/ethylmalonyl-CoA epimerase
MLLDISHVGQIALPVSDVDRAEAFYGGVLGFRKLYRYGDLAFFDCAGVRLLLEKARDPDGHTLALMQEAPKGYVPPSS